MDSLNTNYFCSAVSEVNCIYADHLSFNKDYKIKKFWTNFLSFKDMQYSQLVPENRYENLFFANYTGTVKSINIHTGKKVWEINLKKFLIKNQNVRLSGGISISSSIINYIYVGSEHGIIYALNIRDGKLVWQQQAVGKILSIPQSTNHGLLTIYTNNGFLQALNEIDGSILWTKKICNNVFNKFKQNMFFIKIFLDKIIIVNDKNHMMALSIYNGEIIWEQSIDYSYNETKNLFYHADKKNELIILSNKIYIISEHRYLFCLNAESGKIIWINKYIRAYKILYEKNTLYVIDQYYNIVAINSHTDKIIWTYNSQLIPAKCVQFEIYKGNVIFLDRNKYIYQINIKNKKYIKKEKINISGNIFFMKMFKNYLIILADSGKIYAFSIN